MLGSPLRPPIATLLPVRDTGDDVPIKNGLSGMLVSRFTVVSLGSPIIPPLDAVAGPIVLDDSGIATPDPKIIGRMPCTVVAVAGVTVYMNSSSDSTSLKVVLLFNTLVCTALLVGMVNPRMMDLNKQ